MKSRIFYIILVISLAANVLLTVVDLFKLKQISNESISSASTSLDSLDSWIEPVTLYYDPACWVESGKCPDLGQAQMGTGNDTVRARLFVIPRDRTNVEVRFYMGEKEWVIPRFKTPSFIDSNPDWFSLKIWYKSGSAVYIATSGGHEGYPEYYVTYLGANQPKWDKLDIWSLVKDVFPDTTQPPFSLEVGPQYIRVTEENYCCDTVHKDSPERNANRMVYVLKQEYDEKTQPMYRLVDKDSLPR